MHPQPGPKPAHQQSEVNPPMSQKEHIKKKRAEERKQQELEELHVSMILKDVSISMILGPNYKSRKFSTVTSLADTVFIGLNQNCALVSIRDISKAIYIKKICNEATRVFTFVSFSFSFRDRESYISNNFRWSKLPIVRRVGPHPTSPLT